MRPKKTAEELDTEMEVSLPSYFVLFVHYLTIILQDYTQASNAPAAAAPAAAPATTAAA